MSSMNFYSKALVLQKIKDIKKTLKENQKTPEIYLDKIVW